MPGHLQPLRLLWRPSDAPAFTGLSVGVAVLVTAGDALAAVSLTPTVDAAMKEATWRFGTPPEYAYPSGFSERAHRAVSARLSNPFALVELPWDVCGSPFQHSVWQALQSVPVGSTITYAELARRCARPSAIRAVASACAANPLALLVPCHRVVRSDGALGGFRWGLACKEWLLAQERQAVGATWEQTRPG